MPEDEPLSNKKVSRTIAVGAALLAELEEQAWMERTNLSELICRVMTGYLAEKSATTAPAAG